MDLERNCMNASSILDVLCYRAQYQADLTAYIFLQDGESESGRITYGELDTQAKQIASHLQSLQGERALLLYPSGLEFITAFFGCLYAGIIAVPAYPPTKSRKSSRLKSIIKNAEPKIVLTTASILADIENTSENELSLPKLQMVATNNIRGNSAGDVFFQPAISESVAFLQYTSGSTGMPKGVMVTHGNIIHNQQLIYQAFGHGRHTIVVSWLPLFHDMGLIGHVIHPIYAGITSILMPPVAFLQKPVRWLRAISNYQATTSGGPNFAYDLCVKKIKSEELIGIDLHTWDLAFSGAEPVRIDTLSQFNEKFSDYGFNRNAFYPCYGMAETTLFTTGGNKNREPVTQGVLAEELTQNVVVESEISSVSARVLVGCGHPYLDSTVMIVDPSLSTPCDPGQVGEIWVSGGSVAAGYWNQPEATQEIFKAYLNTGEGPLLRTGDLGFFKGNELFVTGRLKDVIIIRGRNHYPQDVEFTVEHCHYALQENSSAVFSVEISGQECLIVVCEVKRTELKKLNLNEIVNKILVGVSAEHELEVHKVILLRPGSIPKTSSGKIQRSACKAGVLENKLNVVGEWEKNNNKVSLAEASPSQDDCVKTVVEIETWLIVKVAEILEVSPVEIDRQQPLAIYGLDSLKAVNIAVELEKWLGIEVVPTLVYNYPSIHALSNFLGSTSPLPPPSTPYSSREGGAGEIAIIGIGCRFPGAVNPQSFWELLKSGSSGISKIPKTRWESKDSWGGFLEGIDQFDPQFFSISPREASSMDPQQRLLLEVSWEALENASLSALELTASRGGVFIGISSGDYAKLHGNINNVEAYYATGNALSIAANRLSYFFDWHGPSLAIDTACSSSLVAVHQACQSLLSGECNLALAGGVNLMLSPQITLTFTAAQMMAKDGRCKTFDAAADGYVRSEGCGVIVLKRLVDALADGDNIRAVIKGSAVNQDGQTNGLTAPNGNSQQEVIRQALARAGIEASQISYVETHGTGTALGDPIEVNALKTVLMEGRESNQTCCIGSVKTNIGHLEAAAGVAGLIKTVMSLEHAEIPPHLNLEHLNPYIKIADTPIEITTQLRAWPSNDECPRLAGVSAFGFGGTNAHIILEEAPTKFQGSLFKGKDLLTSIGENLFECPLNLLTLSAKTDKALREIVRSYLNYLENSQVEPHIASTCFNANTGRSHFDHRLAILAVDKEDLINILTKISCQEEVPCVYAGKLNSKSSRIAFLFTGQGSQYVNMGRQLYKTQPLFRQTIKHCDRILHRYLGNSLLDVIYPDDSQGLDNSSLNQTVYAQPAIFAIGYALFKLWQSWGIEPDVVMGHSIGEYIAATVAGVFSLEDGLKLVANRARLMQNLPSVGKMVAVFTNASHVTEAIQMCEQQMLLAKSSVVIASINNSKNTVISGQRQEVDVVVAILAEWGVQAYSLQVSHAFHSPLMETMLSEFRQIAETVTYRDSQISLVSNLNGCTVTSEMTTPEYWCQHIVQPVQFFKGMEKLQELGCDTFLELGSNSTLTRMGRYCFPEDTGTWLASLHPERSDWQQCLECLCQLYVKGFNIKWRDFHLYGAAHYLSLPTYPFQRQSYWVEKVHSGGGCEVLQQSNTFSPLLNSFIHSPLIKETLFESFLDYTALPFLEEHKVYGQVVVPAAFYMALLIEVSKINFKSQKCTVEEIFFTQALIMPEGESRKLHLSVSSDNPSTASFKLISLEATTTKSGSFTLHSTGKFCIDSATNGSQEIVSIEQIRERCPHKFPSEALYERNWQQHVELGESFQWVQSLWQGNREALAEMGCPVDVDNLEKYLIHPCLLDACMQLLIATVDFTSEVTLVPFSIEQLEFYHSPGDSQVLCNARLRPESNENRFIGDIQLFDAEGLVIASIKGLECRKIDRQMLLKNSKQVDVEKWLYEIAWKHKQLQSDTSGDNDEPGSWLILADQEGMGQKLVTLLKEQGERCVVVYPGDDYKVWSQTYYTLNPNSLESFQQLFQELHSQHPQLFPNRGIVNLWSMDEPSIEEGEELFAQFGCKSALHLLQAFVKGNWSKKPRLWLVTRGSQPVGGNSTPIQVQQSPVWGLGRVIAMEHPGLWGGLVDLDPNPFSDEAVMLMESIWRPDGEPQVAFRSNNRYVARLQPCGEQFDTSEILIHDQATYLITGGLGDLGLVVGGWLVKRGARHLVLIGRTAASISVQKKITEWEKTGVEVLTLQCDVTRVDRLAEAIATVEGSMPSLQGIIHMAGMLDDGVLMQQEWLRFSMVMNPKIAGAWHLHNLTKNIPLDFFICFSSIASLLGSPGQGNYASANAFLDAFAGYRQAQQLPALTINWGPWTELGMVTRTRGNQTSIAKNIEHISQEQGLLALERMFTRRESQIAVLPVNQSQLQNWGRFAHNTALLEQVIQHDAHLPIGSLSNKFSALTRETLLSTEPDKRMSSLINFLKYCLTMVLQLPSIKINIEQPLNTTGLDSLMALELKNLIEAALGVNLPIVDILEGPTTLQLADQLLEQIIKDSSIVLDTRNLENSLDLSVNIDELSDDEVERLLNQIQEDNQ